MNRTPEEWDALLRRLNDGGCPVLRDHGYKIAPFGLAIEEIPGMNFNRIFDLKQGGTGYAIEVLVRNDSNRPIDIVGCQIKTQWGTPRLSLLPPPGYSFPKPGPSYEDHIVINRYFARRKSRLQPGEEIEGMLVASSEDSIPLGVAHFNWITATLLVFDTRRNAFSGQFRLFVDRRDLSANDSWNQEFASSQLASALAPEEKL
jgi:hypothetical protein